MRVEKARAVASFAGERRRARRRDIARRCLHDEPGSGAARRQVTAQPLDGAGPHVVAAEVEGTVLSGSRRPLLGQVEVAGRPVAVAHRLDGGTLPAELGEPGAALEGEAGIGVGVAVG
jgi:hypothetical protein